MKHDGSRALPRLGTLALQSGVFPARHGRAARRPAGAEAVTTNRRPPWEPAVCLCVPACAYTQASTQTGPRRYPGDAAGTAGSRGRGAPAPARLPRRYDAVPREGTRPYGGSRGTDCSRAHARLSRGRGLRNLTNVRRLRSSRTSPNWGHLRHRQIGPGRHPDVYGVGVTPRRRHRSPTRAVWPGACTASAWVWSTRAWPACGHWRRWSGRSGERVSGGIEGPGARGHPRKVSRSLAGALCRTRLSGACAPGGPPGRIRPAGDRLSGACAPGELRPPGDPLSGACAPGGPPGRIRPPGDRLSGAVLRRASPQSRHPGMAGGDYGAGVPCTSTSTRWFMSSVVLPQE
jgi:hypothetical protein